MTISRPGDLPPDRAVVSLIGARDATTSFQQRKGRPDAVKDGRSVRIDYRFAPASPDQAQVYAKELVALRPDILVGNSTPAAAALLRETRTIPIVFVGVSDPAGSHFVASIPKPGGSSSPLGRRICARG